MGRNILQNLNKNLSNHSFSHIYVEKDARHHPRALKILDRLKQAEVIEINHYKDVFSRAHQNYVMQKVAPKLILAIKKKHLIYRGADVCESFGHQHFYYTSTMMNCLYNCEYCYLQGMYPSANIVVFVNIEAIFNEVEQLLKQQNIYLCISYDTDILALENLVGYAREWINFAHNHKNMTMELRTKSANFHAIEDIPPSKNVILAWTLSPVQVIEHYEKKTPGLNLRLSNINKALEKGWQVRVCIDPIVYIKDWREAYQQLIKTTFNTISKDKIKDVSIGVFRVSKPYLKKMRKQLPNSILINYPYETKNGICSYPYSLSENMVNTVYSFVRDYIDEDKIYQ